MITLETKINLEFSYDGGTLWLNNKITTLAPASNSIFILMLYIFDSTGNILNGQGTNCSYASNPNINFSDGIFNSSSNNGIGLSSFLSFSNIYNGTLHNSQNLLLNLSDVPSTACVFGQFYQFNNCPYNPYQVQTSQLFPDSFKILINPNDLLFCATSYLSYFGSNNPDSVSTSHNLNSQYGSIANVLQNPYELSGFIYPNPAETTLMMQSNYDLWTNASANGLLYNNNPIPVNSYSSSTSTIIVPSTQSRLSVGTRFNPKYQIGRRFR